ncbi:hypothetical protein [Streptomyces sp. SYSU K21746]
MSRPQFDSTVTMPVLARLRGLVTAHDWAGTADFFAQLQHEDERAFACSLVGGIQGAEEFLERAAAQHSTASLPRVLLADRLIRAGWDIRSGARAKHVSRQQFDGFHGYLRRAQALLIEVCAEEPDNALAWYLRITTARGLELGESEARRRYDRLAEHHPHHYPAQGQLIQQLAPKWGGSWEAMFTFARECAEAAPPGSHSAAVIAQAHLERWQNVGHGEDVRCLRDPAIRAELLAAAQKSVLHPAYRPGFHWIGAHGYFAAVHSLAGNHVDAAPHFRVLGNCASEFPWTLLGHQEAVFVRHRKTALAKG